jgi:hypothetical protein
MGGGCSLIDVDWYFGETLCLHLQDLERFACFLLLSDLLAYFSTLKMVTVRSSEFSVCTYTRLDDITLQIIIVKSPLWQPQIQL